VHRNKNNVTEHNLDFLQCEYEGTNQNGSSQKNGQSGKVYQLLPLCPSENG